MTSITINRQQTAKRAPQLRLTVCEVMERRRAMRSDQYLADILAAMKKAGWKFLINDIPAFAKKIGLSTRTFQRARRLLIDTGRLIENRINRDSVELFLVTNDDITITQNDITIAQDDKDDAQGDKIDTMTYPEPVPGNDSEAPPTLRSTIYNNSLSITRTEKTEREIEKQGTKEIEPEYRAWLHQQALKMPRAIANIPVWIRKVAHRPEWKESFIEWFVESEKSCFAALPPSTNTAVFIAPDIHINSEEAQTEILEAIQQAKAKLHHIQPAKPSNDRGLPSNEAYKSLGLRSI